MLGLLAALPGVAEMPVEQLREAVPGLAGISGLLLFPFLGGWIRLLIETIEWDRTGLNRPRRMSGAGLLRAIGISVLFAFFSLTTIRAASELRSVQAEFPVVTTVLEGLAVGIAFWALYAVGMSTLRRDARRRRNEQRMGGLLR